MAIGGAFGCHLFCAYDVVARLLKNRSDILQGSVDHKVTNCCLDRLTRLRVEREVVEVVLREVG